MKSMRARIAVLFLAILVSGTTSAVGQSRSTTDDIKRFMNDFLHAMGAGDAKGISEMFADDASVFYPSQPFPRNRVAGRADIEAAWQQGFASFKAPSNIDPKRLQIQGYGEFAVVTFELDANPPRVGRRTFVLQRKAGTWKIIHLHASNRTE